VDLSGLGSGESGGLGVLGGLGPGVACSVPLIYRLYRDRMCAFLSWYIGEHRAQVPEDLMTSVLMVLVWQLLGLACTIAQARLVVQEL